MMQDQSVMGHHRQIKLVVVGDGAVGQWMKIMKLLLPVLNGKRPSLTANPLFFVGSQPMLMRFGVLMDLVKTLAHTKVY